jgi:signal transduction histidine kinase
MILKMLMKLPASFLPKWIKEFAASAVVILCILQIAFILVQSQIASKIETAVSSIFTGTNAFINPSYISQAAAGLESAHLISCVKVRKSDQPAIFYESPKENCPSHEINEIYLNGEEKAALVKSPNGEIWEVHFRAENGELFYFTLWTMRLVLLSLSWILFSRNEWRIESIKKLEEIRVKSALDLASLASQVSHDIRSPLVALNMIINSLHSLPEEKIQIVRSAIQRINDIANQLLKRGGGGNAQASPNAKEENPTMLITTIESIVSEKRIQLRPRPHLQLKSTLETGYGLFTTVDHITLGSIISNLLNNSAEALTLENGVITIDLRSDENHSIITIQDTGRGIPPEILTKIGERGITYGKENTESGSGLGIYQARKTVVKAGGKLIVESTVGKGTTVTLWLPKILSPQWFVEKIEVGHSQTIVVLDDDQTIHQVWGRRLKTALPPSFNDKFLSFSSPISLEEWLRTNREKHVLFLIDYQFDSSSINGLDLVEKLSIARNSILVTSRFEETLIRERARALGIKILPKNLASVVPIFSIETSEKYNAVVIDDDPLVHSMWSISAKAKGKKVICFSSAEEFAETASKIDKASPLFIDVNLANGVRGEKVAEQAAALGFTEIALATGYAPHTIQAPSCVKRIVGKDPIFDT